MLEIEENVFLASNEVGVSWHQPWHGSLKVQFAHITNKHKDSMCPSFEISLSEILSSTPIKWRTMEFQLWRSIHLNISPLSSR